MKNIPELEHQELTIEQLIDKVGIKKIINAVSQQINMSKEYLGNYHFIVEITDKLLIKISVQQQHHFKQLKRMFQAQNTDGIGENGYRINHYNKTYVLFI